jgi:hypothetical protein
MTAVSWLPGDWKPYRFRAPPVGWPRNDYCRLRGIASERSPRLLGCNPASAAQAIFQVPSGCRQLVK